MRKKTERIKYFRPTIMKLLFSFWNLDSEGLLYSSKHKAPEKAMAPHSSALAWKIPWKEEPGRLWSMGSKRVGRDWMTSLSHIGERNGNPLQCSCLENPRDGGAWWAAVYGISQSQTRLKWHSSSKHKALRPKFSSVESLSRVQFFVTPWTAAHQASLSSPTPRAYLNSCSSRQWCHLTISSSVIPFSSCLQSFPAFGSFPMSQFFASGGQSISFSLIISSSNEYSGLISFRIDWFDLLAVWRTFKSLLQHHSSKASVRWHSAFFIVQLSYPYMTTGKTIALTRWTFVGKVTSLLFNMLSRLVIAFLPRGKHCLISWLQSPSAVTLEPPKIKSLTVSIIFPSICHEVMGLDVMRPKCQVSIRPKYHET